MKILLLFTDWRTHIGGIAAFNRAFTRALAPIAAEKNWNIHVVTLHDRPEDAPPDETMKKWSLRAFGGNRFAFSAAAVQAGAGADLVITGHAHLSPVALLTTAPHRWMIAHGVEVWSPLPGLRRRAVQSMEKILTVSRFTQETMVAQKLAPPWVFDWLPDTLPARESGPPMDRRALGLPEGPMILCVSRLHPGDAYKRIDLLIDALPRVRLSFPKLFLTVVGDGPDRKRLERLAEEVGDAVHFTGRVADAQLGSYYDACDVFALPSTQEGFGIVYLEAMAHGKPCIGVRAAAVPEVILDGKTGLLAMPDDRVSLESAMLRLLEFPDDSKRMGKAGLKRLQEHFAFGAFERRLRGIFGLETVDEALRKAA